VGAEDCPRNRNEDLKEEKNRNIVKIRKRIKRWGVKPKDTTYGNVCKNVIFNTETCWTAEDPVRHGHAPVV